MGTASLVGLLTGVLSIAREPVRLTLRVWEFGLSTAAEAARLGLEMIESDRPDSPGGFAEYRAGLHPAHDGNGVAPDVGRATVEVVPEPPVPDVEDAPPAVPDELIPDHVDVEPVLVAEVAEEGAEDGAGPELHVAEPWDGYDRMAAVEICDRLTAATAELAAAVELYESGRRSRRSALDAAERALRARRPTT